MSKIDKQLRNARWDIVSKNEYLPNSTTVVKKAYIYDDSVEDDLKASSRLYRIITDVSAHGGTIEKVQEAKNISKL